MNEQRSAIRPKDEVTTEVLRGIGVEIGQPREVPELLSAVQPAALPPVAVPTMPGVPSFAQLQQDRAARDTALWNALWEALESRLRTAVQETARDLAEAEKALDGARAHLADLDSHQPSKAADVPKWAQKRGEVAGRISAYESLVYGARQAYEKAARAARAAAQGIVAKQAEQASAAHTRAEAEYRTRREAARQELAEANEARNAVGRLFEKVNSGDLDLFR